MCISAFVFSGKHWWSKCQGLRTRQSGRVVVAVVVVVVVIIVVIVVVVVANNGSSSSSSRSTNIVVEVSCSNVSINRSDKRKIETEIIKDMNRCLVGVVVEVVGRRSSRSQ